MEPVRHHCDKGIYYYIGNLRDLPNFKYHRKMFINTFEELSSDLRRLADTPSRLDDYSVLYVEYQNALNGHCPFVSRPTITKIQRLLFYRITTHSEFNDLSRTEIISFLKSGDIPRLFWDSFLKHPAINNITKSEYKLIKKEAKENKETAFLQWFECSPSSEVYMSSEARKREHDQIISKMRQDAPDLLSDERKKGAFYLAIRKGFYTSAAYHLDSMTTLSLEDAVFYISKGIELGQLDLVKAIVNKFITKSDHSDISKIFECMKKEIEQEREVEVSRTYKKLVLKVIKNMELDVLSVLLIYESIFFEDNIAEQQLCDLIDGCVEENDYDKIQSFYIFSHFDIDDLIKNSAEFYLIQWIATGQREKALEFLNRFPKFFNFVLEISVKAGTPEDLKFFIEAQGDLTINTTQLLTCACEEEKLENIKFLIEEFRVDVNDKRFKVPLINMATAKGNLALVAYLFSKGAHTHQNTLINAIFSDNLDVVQLVLFGMPVPKNEEQCLILLKNVIRDGRVDILKALEKHFRIDLKSFLIRELNDKWTIDTLLEIIFKGCRNSISMMEYFSDILKTYFLIKPTLIESYISNASSDQFHEKIYLISLTCADNAERLSFQEIAKKNYNLVNAEVWGKLAGNLYLSDSDQIALCSLLKKCNIDG